MLVLLEHTVPERVRKGKPFAAWGDASRSVCTWFCVIAAGHFASVHHNYSILRGNAPYDEVSILGDLHLHLKCLVLGAVAASATDVAGLVLPGGPAAAGTASG